ncbi:tryptophan synthase subunit alpha [Jiulongibacter sediminis]|uniref:Tryptophan synthase alpha chain n=1 Tax=Jiulongibacter sediminis TaxID=1605367 RepID=A0A0P7BHV4_9BACT|nr:tryptophan synthase subunit alpha [Jiulongibacter sediminis]KPM46597.1 tryptophan synthase alpha chain [Jiulongibacter sediminis]TBX21455.1 tryptophan synthase alpha chain [Jiulongibacter sediminis]
MNRLEKLFIEKPKDILNIYFTAGFPGIEDTMPLLRAIEKAGADIAEIGIPFSDPVADGETIQKANTQALDNGMTVELLFSQLKEMRNEIKIPIILMGDVNPLIQYGLEPFCKKCQEVGVDGLILPNLPMDEYLLEFKPVFEKYGLFNIFLITPQTSEDRIRRIDENSAGFIYMVSSASTTGSTSGITDEMRDYFDRVDQMKLKNPRLIGFGIKDHSTFTEASHYANGAIIGSAFIRAIKDSEFPAEAGSEYIKSVLG